MKKVVIVPDSFKGTVSSQRICEIIKEKVKSRFPLCEVVSIPVADGGEGSVDCFLAISGGEKITLEVSGPYGEKVKAYYGILPDGAAVIEMAACSGLPLVGDNKNPLLTTTYGVGELIKDSVKRGCKKVILCLGGSCTNDMGAGMAVALGVLFYDEAGNSFIPTGGTLEKVEYISVENIMPEIKDVEFIAMCDIENPLYGKEGAAYVFAPQKGADENGVRLLDEGLRHLDGIVGRDVGLDVAFLPGSGAAGGMGAGAVAFLGATLKPGIETVLDAAGFDEKIDNADFVFTGEGKMDSQSLRGKVVSGVAKRSKKKGIPVIAVVGGYEPPLEPFYDIGIKAVFATNPLPSDFEKIKNKSEENLDLTVENVIRLLNIIEKDGPV